MFDGAEPLVHLCEMPLDGFVRIGELFGRGIIVEA